MVHRPAFNHHYRQVVILHRVGSLHPLYLCLRREECSSLRNELSERHQKDSRAAVTELIQRKEEELRVANDKWRQEVEILNKKVSKDH